jgi:hypothetical protein
MLGGHSIVWPTEPISLACKASSTCQSYLLIGLSQTVWPWPYATTGGYSFSLNQDTAAFKLGSASYYQVDLWEPTPLPPIFDRGSPPRDEVEFDTAKDCNRYGVSNTSTLNICLTENIKNVRLLLVSQAKPAAAHSLI